MAQDLHTTIIEQTDILNLRDRLLWFLRAVADFYKAEEEAGIPHQKQNFVVRALQKYADWKENRTSPEKQ